MACSTVHFAAAHSRLGKGARARSLISSALNLLHINLAVGPGMHARADDRSGRILRCTIVRALGLRRAFRRLDWVIAMAKKYGVRVIFPFVNYENDLTGGWVTCAPAVDRMCSCCAATYRCVCSVRYAARQFSIGSSGSNFDLGWPVCSSDRRGATWDRRTPAGMLLLCPHARLQPGELLRYTAHRYMPPNRCACWSALAGIKFYVDNILGKDKDKEYFFGSSQVGMQWP